MKMKYVLPLGVLLLAASLGHAQPVPNLGSLWISLMRPGVVAGIPVDRGDILACTPAPSGPSHCAWQLVFDASDVGLTSNIGALDVLPDGRLLIRLATRQPLPGVTKPVQDQDLVLFTPTQFGPDTAGTWSLYLDGRFTTRAWDGLTLSGDGTLLVSPPRNGAEGIVQGAKDEDILTCRPSATDVNGAIVNCVYGMHLKASQYGMGDGTDLSEFDVARDGSLLFVGGSAAGLPPHEPRHDILRLHNGAFEIYFSADAAGLGNNAIGGLALVDDADGDGVIDERDNCPTTANPGQENVDRDGQGDVCDACPHVANATPQAMAARKVVLAFPNGAGGGDDRVKQIRGTFRTNRPLDLGVNDALLVSVSRADNGLPIFAGNARTTDGQWKQLGSPGPDQRWLFQGAATAGGGLKSVAVRRLGFKGFVNRLKAKGAFTNLSAVPLDANSGVRVVVEIADNANGGLCFERRMRCRRAAVGLQKCRP